MRLEVDLLHVPVAVADLAARTIRAGHQPGRNQHAVQRRECMRRISARSPIRLCARVDYLDEIKAFTAWELLDAA